MKRRDFLMLCSAGVILPAVLPVKKLFAQAAPNALLNSIQEVQPGEDVFAYIVRVKGKFDQTLYQQVIGAANAFKEGDLTIGVGAADEKTGRMRASSCRTPGSRTSMNTRCLPTTCRS